MTRPLGLVTLTPRALAFSRISTRLREETAWPILLPVSFVTLLLSPFSLGLNCIGNILSGEGAVVHKEKLNVTGVLDEESLVARGHHVLGLLVATVSDLSNHIYQHSFSTDWRRNSEWIVRTEGIGRLLLKRRRTQLSIPLGLRHAEGTHLKRSDWWRQKVLVPVGLGCSQSSVLCRGCVCIHISIYPLVHPSFRFSFPSFLLLHPRIIIANFVLRRYRFPPFQPYIPFQ